MASGNLIITVGLPGSGKTTWALDQIESGQADVRVNRDDLRMAMFGKYVLIGRQEKEVSRVQNAAVELLLARGKTVIVDDTNLRQKTRKAWRELAERCLSSYAVKDWFLEYSVDTCQYWAELRKQEGGRGVSSDVIWQMAKRYSQLVKDQRIPTGEPRRSFLSAATLGEPLRNRQGTPAIIVDIDGTVADHNGRDPYNAKLAYSDLLYGDTSNVVKSVQASGKRLLFVSGRSGEFREITEMWLDKHGFRDYVLHMRAVGDRRDDSIVKQEIYTELIYPMYNVIAVFDDRDRVVAMWRRLGLQVMQVNYGAF
jgi:predicted kinase